MANPIVTNEMENGDIMKAASSAKRVLFIKDGKVFHQLYRGNLTNEEMYERISDTLKVLTTGGEEDE